MALASLLTFTTTQSSYATEPIELKHVAVTAYCYGTKTSSGKRVREGHIALSRPIVKKYRLKFGDTIIVAGHGKFIFEDLMPPQWKRPRCDIYIPNKKVAYAFGLKRLDIVIIKQETIMPSE